MQAFNNKCQGCGLTNFAGATNCRRCGAALIFAQPGPAYPVAHQPAPFRVNPAEYVNRGGKTCPRCGVTNSDSTMSGQAIVLIVVLFITCIGLLAIPFLPKTWTCRYCGFTW